MDSGRHPQSGQRHTNLIWTCACQVLGPEHHVSKAASHDTRHANHMGLHKLELAKHLQVYSNPDMRDRRTFARDKWRRSWQARIRSTYLCKVLKTWTAPGRRLRLHETSPCNASSRRKDYNRLASVYLLLLRRLPWSRVDVPND